MKNREGENPGRDVLEKVLIRLLIELLTWLVHKLSTANGKGKSGDGS